MHGHTAVGHNFFMLLEETWMQPDMDADCEIRAVGGQGPSRSGVMRPGLWAPGLDPRPTTDDRRVPSGERDCARRHPDPVALELGWER